MTKLFVLGLDCATPQLIFDKYLQSLPTLSGLIRYGNYGLLESTVPPVTVPAWMAMMTGKDPGQLGFYGFSDRKNYSYNENYIVTNKAVKDKTVWDYLGDNGLRSIVMNLPQTYPPKPINGILISSFLTPDKELTYTYPEEIKDELDEIAEGNYIIDVENFRTPDKKKLLSELYTMAKNRFKVIKNFIKNKEWDLFVAVEMGIDRMHHAFWSYCFSDHQLYVDNNEFKTALIDYYKFIDLEISELLKTFDDDTELMITSDHGAKTLKGTFCINDWLIRNKYLHLKTEIGTKTTFDADMVDWSNTMAWGSGGYYGKIYLNIKGREPNGVIPESDIEMIFNKIKQELSEQLTPGGNKVQNEYFEPKKTYNEVNGCPPDLIIYIDNLAWRVTGSMGNQELFLREHTAIDNSNHDKAGIFIHTKNPRAALDFNEKVECDLEKIMQYSILDIAPTILKKFNIGIPNNLKGRVIS
ncbi:alkaline phosphatase family protein [[Eubacterium] cellulosolvens]